MEAYRGILDTFGLAAFQREAAALVLHPLRSHEALDLGGFGVRLLALALGLDFAADDEFADLQQRPNVSD